MSRFTAHIAPMERVPQTRRWPEAMQESAVRLSMKIGVAKAAYVFGINQGRLYHWRRRLLTETP